MPEAGEVFIIFINATCKCSYPKDTRAIEEYRIDRVVADGVFIQRIVPVVNKSLSGVIVTFQSFFSSDPDISVSAVKEGVNGIIDDILRCYFTVNVSLEMGKGFCCSVE